MVALNAISFILVVILVVFAATLVSREVILEVLEAILFVFEVILEVLDVTLASIAVILAVLDVTLASIAVILAVLDAIEVGKVAMVDELTPPTLLIVVLNVPVPDPLTSPITVKVVFVFVPPAMVKPFASAVGVTPLIILFVKLSVPVKVAIVPDVGKVIFVTPVVVKVVL